MNFDFEVIITAHKEGWLLNQTAKSVVENLDFFATSEHGDKVSVTIFLDNPDEWTIKAAENISQINRWRIFVDKQGDPGQSRLSAIRSVDSEMIALLDGDDLWSYNWLCESAKFLHDGRYNIKELILHPEYNHIFEGANLLVRQGDPEAFFFDPEYFRFGNYWDALCIAHRDVFDKIPYVPNNVSQGIGHEDYLWSMQTWLQGLNHRLVPNTVHFKRKRHNSVSAIVNSNYAKPVITDLNLYRYW